MESQAHIDLVNRIYNYIIRFVDEEKRCLIERDSSGNNSGVRVINNFVPDIYYSFDSLMIIGEAKTEMDFERRHSKAQYESYIEECKLFDGEAILVIGVPWQVCASAKNYFKRKKNVGEINFKVCILDEMGRDYEI